MTVLQKPATRGTTAASETIVDRRFAQDGLGKLLCKRYLADALSPMEQNSVGQPIPQALQTIPVFMLPRINGLAHIIGHRTVQ
jgi:hypothetical protein